MVNDRGPTGAHILLLNAGKYFDMLPGGKQIIASFLFPSIPKELVPYNTEEPDPNIFLGTLGILLSIHLLLNVLFEKILKDLY